MYIQWWNITCIKTNNIKTKKKKQIYFYNET